MNNDSFIQADNAFKKGLQHFEAPFEDASWEDMKQLLDKDKKPVGLLLFSATGKFTRNFNPKKTLIVMSIFSIIAISSAVVCNQLAFEPATRRPTAGSKKSAATVAKNNQQAATNELYNMQSAGNTSPTEGTVLYAEAALKNASVTDAGTMPKMYAGSKNISAKKSDDNLNPNPPTTSSPIGTVKTETVAVDSGKNDGPPKAYYTRQYVVRSYWVDDEYEYFTEPKQGPIKDCWMGLHFTRQQGWNWQKDSAWPNQVQTGFNLQLMSGTLAKHKHFAAYWGGDWGMQFYGRTKNSTVIYNTFSSDTGFTRMNSLSSDLMLKGHFEYTIGRFSPYLNLSAGPRIYGTSQYISAYYSVGDSTGEDRHNVKTSASFMAGVGVGARFRMNEWASVDMRYEWMRGTPVSVVDLQNSKFNNLTYDLETQTITPQSQQFKFGIIFDLSPAKRSKKLVKEGHYVQQVIDSVMIDENDTLIRYLPCECKPCDKAQRKYEEPDEVDDNTLGSPKNRQRDAREEEKNRHSNHNGPVNPGGSKGKVFPGVKPPKSRF